jgi:hypothetical protein
MAMLESTKRGRPPQPIEQRFWKYVDRTGQNNCWLWTGLCYASGYGRIKIPATEASHQRPRIEYAHRLSWTLHFGQIPKGMCVCHSCDSRYEPGDITSRRCVNPNHLWIGSHTANISDRDAKGRGRSRTISGNRAMLPHQ